MRKKVFIYASMLILSTFVFCETVLSWDNEITHRDLSSIAAENSVLSGGKGNYLKNVGFDGGLDETFKWISVTKTAKQWLAEGAYFEDEPFTRSLNHFHNPLKPWEQAELNDVFSGKSSILWAQDSSNEWSWKKTRDCFYLALTSKTDAERQAYFAQTFKGLGHQMHLIQDAAQPDHVRNDAHPEDAIFGKNMLNSSAFFESWAKSERQRIIDLAANPVFPNVPFDVSNNSFAPITQFYDTDRYDGLNASAGINQGIAEYTNANFFSGDTIFATERYSTGYKHYFPYPKKSSTDLQAYIAQIKPLLVQIAEDGIADKGMWIKKERDGENIDHFVRAGRWTSKIYKIFGEVPMFYRSFYLDEECHQDYAEKLIPRAVGYSSQALSYFFRAKMDLLPADPATDGFVIKNDTAETMEGEFHLYYDNENDSRVEIQSGDFPINAMTIGGNGSSANVNFDTPPDAKKPGEYIVVFRGKMGEETGSVAARVVLIENAEYVIVTMSMVNSTRCFVWNVGKNELAIINDNSGYPVTFPCDPANISNWVNSHKSIGKPLFEEAVCGISTLPLNASCNVWGCKNTCSDEDSYDQPSNCGGTFRNIGTQLINRIGEYKSDLTTHEHYDTWKYPLAAQDMGAWWSFSNYPKQLSLKFSYLNQSSVTGAFRIERTVDRYFYRNTDGGNCANKYDGYSTNEERLSFHVPLADAMVFNNDSIANNNWNLVARTGSQAEENVIRALNARLYGEFSGKTIAQIHAFAISTGTRYANCCNDPYYGICAGSGCTGTYTCPWSPIVYTVSDLKVAAQVGHFRDGTAGIDPTALPRNSSFEAIISNMYAALRNVENVPSDKLAGFELSVQIK